MKARGLLLTCVAFRAEHLEIVNSLALKNFLMEFNRFNDVCGKVEVIYLDNAFTFQAASEALPDMLKSPELRNYPLKKE